MQTHKVYILYTGSYCKIGVTKRPIEKRIKELQTGCPLHIHKVRYISNLTHNQAYDIEKAVHKHLSFHHSHGEWFRYFAGISKSVIKISHEYTPSFDVQTKTYSTPPTNRDASITFSNTIKKAIMAKDITKLSQIEIELTTNIQGNTQFLLYSRETLVELIQTNIKFLIYTYQIAEVDSKKIQYYKQQLVQETTTNFDETSEIINELRVLKAIIQIKKHPNLVEKIIETIPKEDRQTTRNFISGLNFKIKNTKERI